MLAGITPAQALGFLRRHLPAHRDDDRSVGEGRCELADQAKRFGAEGREQPRGDRRPLALANLDKPVALEPTTQNTLTLVLWIEDPPDLVEDQRRPFGVHAAVDRRLGHAVGLLAATAEPV